jgi:hypothetical protein
MNPVRLDLTSAYTERTLACTDVIVSLLVSILIYILFNVLRILLPAPLHGEYRGNRPYRIQTGHVSLKKFVVPRESRNNCSEVAGV